MNRATLYLRVFGFLKIPLIFYVNPTVCELSAERCVVRIPLTRKTKNHLGSMYFGALSIGADVAGGLIAWDLIEKSKQKINLVFKDFKAEFLKRPTGDVYFVCEDGAKVKALVERAVTSGERVEETVSITAQVKDKKTNHKDDVAKFLLTISLKKSIGKNK